MAKLVSKTYGDALFELAVSEGNLESVTNEVQSLLKIFDENEDMLVLLSGDGISKEDKWNFLSDVFSESASDTIMGLLKVVVDKGRSPELKSILEYYLKLTTEHNRIGLADVTSAVPLSDEQKEKVVNRLLAITDYVSFNVNYKVDEKLIGGIVIRIGDRVFDSSVKNSIEKMQRQLAKLQLS